MTRFHYVLMASMRAVKLVKTVTAFRLYLPVWAWRVLRFGAFHLAERSPQNLPPAPRPIERDIATIGASGYYFHLQCIVVREHRTITPSQSSP